MSEAELSELSVQEAYRTCHGAARTKVWGMAYSRAPMPCTTVSGYRYARCRRSCASCAGYPSLSNQAEVGEESQQLRASVKDAKRGFTDDTGWRINGESASMMGFDTDEETVYKSVSLKQRMPG